MVMSVVSPKRSSLSSVFSRVGGYYHVNNSKKRCSSFYGSSSTPPPSSMAYDSMDDEDGTMEMVQLGANRTKNVLILMSDTGGGHRASAEAIRDAFKLEFGDEYNIIIKDVWKEYTGWPLNDMERQYKFMVKHVQLWKVAFHGTSPKWIHSMYLAAIAAFYAKEVEAGLMVYKPDIIISVHPLMQHIPLWVLKWQALQKKVIFVTVITDLNSCHRTWFHPSVNRCYCPSEEVAKRASLDGLEDSQIKVFGLPVRPSFARAILSKDDARLELEMDPDLPAVLLMGGGEGMGPVKKTAMALAESLYDKQLEKPIGQLIIICGRNRSLASSLESLEWKIPVKVRGFEKQMEKWMGACDCIITKAGPGTIAEALIRGLPIILNDYIPGQEKGNVPYVVENGAGVFTRSPKETARIVSEWFSTKRDELNKMSENALRLAKPEAVFEINSWCRENMNSTSVSAPHLLKIHGSLTCQRRNDKFQCYKVPASSLRMAVPFRAPRLRMQTFSGLRVSSPVLGSRDNRGLGLGFDFKVKDAMLVNRGKPSRSVVTAVFSRFTDKAAKVVLIGQEETRRLSHSVVGTEQILLGLIGEGTGIASKVLRSMGISMKSARIEVEKIAGRGSGVVPVEIPFSPRAKHVLELSFEEARKLGVNYISTEHLLLGLLSEGEGVAARVLDNLGLDPKEIRKQVIKMVAEYKEPVANVGGNSGNSMVTLEEFGTNLTKAAEEGKLDPVVGRQKQIERVIQILSRRTKNNPCLVGEPGVGKTSIAEGLALKIVDRDVPETLEGKQVITLDLSRLVSGTKYRGEFEGRLQKIMEEVKESSNLILFIDEVHTLVGAGAAEGAIDAANILKPALARGELQCIGATTLDEYRLHIEKDPALERRFQPVEVPEPTVREAIQILRGLRERYEIHHKLSYTDDALVAAAELASQYISDRFLPDKAIDLIDEAGSRVRLRHAEFPEDIRELEKELRQIVKEKDGAVRNQEFEKAAELRDQELDLKVQISAFINQNKELKEANMDDAGPVVTAAEIREIVFSWTGIPVQEVSVDESSRLLKMEDNLHGRVIGQDEAVGAISRAIRRARVGLKDPDRPIASFIFSGPTGVGKSELAKALAAYYFGSEEAMIRLDMSEFMERHTVSKLIGSPPGYVGYSEGGQLTEAVRRRPYSLVLFDEIEKAHHDVFNMMLQILEDGRLTDSKGRTVNFKNTLIVMTSNIGSSVIEKGGRSIGFDLTYDDTDNSYNRIKSLVIEELKQYFRPEFLNRLDDMIVFRQLTKLEVKEIADIMLKEVFKRLETKGINVQVTEFFRDKVVEEGYSPTYGARPLRRAIMRLLEDSMAEKMLAREIQEGDSVILDVDSSGNVVVLNSSRSSSSSSILIPELCFL